MVQVVRQTWQERFDMYMKHTKKELASMLAENAKYVSPDACAEFAYKDSVECISNRNSINID